MKYLSSNKLVTMRTTFEIQQASHELNIKEIMGRLLNLKQVWNVEVDREKGLISFEYGQHPTLDMVRKELLEMGYYVINDTHHFDGNTKP